MTFVIDLGGSLSCLKNYYSVLDLIRRIWCRYWLCGLGLDLNSYHC